MTITSTSMTTAPSADLAQQSVAICPASRLTANRGMAALVQGWPIAVFALADGTIAAIDNIDPCSGASVLSRGIIGELDGAVTVASPMYKHRFDLRTGRCLDVEGVRVAVHRAAVVDGMIHVLIDGSLP
jgi:nitrite reductase (NADH) small subunit